MDLSTIEPHHEKLSDIQHNIMVNVITKRLGYFKNDMPTTRSLQSVSINPTTTKLENGNTQDPSNHTFLIDRYKEITTKTRYTYGLERDPWNNENEDDPYETDPVDEMGNKIGWAYTKEEIRENTQRMVSMVWGYSYFYNSVFYSAYSTDWAAGGHVFNLDHKIYTRSDVK